jgi:hypothetical protein
VRALFAKVAIAHPLAVAKCNDDMEALVSDTNRTIATLAITTLLKTGSESSVDRLMKQIATFMSEITDEFKVGRRVDWGGGVGAPVSAQALCAAPFPCHRTTPRVSCSLVACAAGCCGPRQVVVVKAIHELCLRYPGKYRVLLLFLSTSLREEGGFDFKRAILDAIFDIIDKVRWSPQSAGGGVVTRFAGCRAGSLGGGLACVSPASLLRTLSTLVAPSACAPPLPCAVSVLRQIPDASNEGLLMLCEFIEDCEFASLSVRVLHLLADKGPHTPAPGACASPLTPPPPNPIPLFAPPSRAAPTHPVWSLPLCLPLCVLLPPHPTPGSIPTSA